jgi:hypothetical protein
VWTSKSASDSAASVVCASFGTLLRGPLIVLIVLLIDHINNWQDRRLEAAESSAIVPGQQVILIVRVSNSVDKDRVFTAHATSSSMKQSMKRLFTCGQPCDR